MTTTNIEQTERIVQSLRRMDAETRAMVVFGLGQAMEDQQTAVSAGHGYSALPLHHDERDTKHRWTLLREDNVRLSYDYRFLDAFDPDSMAEDTERKIDLLLRGDHSVVRLLIQQWKDHKDFNPEWLDARPNGRQYSERHDAIWAAIKGLREKGETA